MLQESTLKSPENFGVSLCNVCGCRGPHRCAKCKLISYCSKEHQKLDWSEHRDECGSRSVKGIRHYLFDIPLSPFFFPKYELTLEEEDCEKVKEVDKEKKSEAMDDEEDDESENEETEKAKLKEFDEFVKANDPNSKLDVEDLEKYATGEDDQDFSYFKKRTLIYPDQVCVTHICISSIIFFIWYHSLFYFYLVSFVVLVLVLVLYIFIIYIYFVPFFSFIYILFYDNFPSMIETNQKSLIL